MSDLVFEKIEEYDNEFEDGFPTMILYNGNNADKVINIIEHCLQENKDVYELGYVDEFSDKEY